MKKTLLLMLALLVWTSVSCGQSGAKVEQHEQPAVQVDEQAADTATTGVAVLKAVDASLSGEAAFKQIMDTYAGEVVVLDFWATWCPPLSPCNGRGGPHQTRIDEQGGTLRLYHRGNLASG